MKRKVRRAIRLVDRLIRLPIGEALIQDRELEREPFGRMDVISSIYYCVLVFYPFGLVLIFEHIMFSLATSGRVSLYSFPFVFSVILAISVRLVWITKRYPVDRVCRLLGEAKVERFLLFYRRLHRVTTIFLVVGLGHFLFTWAKYWRIF